MTDSFPATPIYDQLRQEWVERNRPPEPPPADSTTDSPPEEPSA